MAVVNMDKFIYRGIIGLCCIILAIVLVITPVLLRMYLDIKKAEMRVEKKLSNQNRKDDEK